MSTHGVRRFVEDLVRQRRVRPVPIGPEDEAELRTAITLRAAQPESDAPSEEFVIGLRDRLAAQLAKPEPEPAKPPTRRRFVQVASAAAASAAVGAGIGYTVSSAQAGDQPQDRTLTPNNGQWRPVVESRDLPEGAVRPFDLGAVNGFVRRTGGVLRAVSGVCTHLGCKLTLDAPAGQLNCPCHRAAFAVTGEVLNHQLPIALSPLPQLQVREIDGVVQILAPPSA